MLLIPTMVFKQKQGSVFDYASQRQREWSAAGVKSYSSTFTKYYGLKIRSKLLPEKKQDVEFCHDAALLLITVYG